MVIASMDLLTAAARRTGLVLPEQAEEAPAVGLLHPTSHGARIEAVCTRCTRAVTISHGRAAPPVDAGNYVCLRCRA